MLSTQEKQTIHEIMNFYKEWLDARVYVEGSSLTDDSFYGRKIELFVSLDSRATRFFSLVISGPQVLVYINKLERNTNYDFIVKYSSLDEMNSEKENFIKEIYNYVATLVEASATLLANKKITAY